MRDGREKDTRENWDGGRDRRKEKKGGKRELEEVGTIRIGTRKGEAVKRSTIVTRTRAAEEEKEETTRRVVVVVERTRIS